MADMGELLQKLRQEKGFTQAELAEQLDITQQHVSAVERGVRPASWDYIVAFANVVGANVLNLLRQAGLLEPTTVSLEQEIAALLATNPAFEGLIEFAREHPEQLREVLDYAHWITRGAPEEEVEESRAAPKSRRRSTEADT